ncbi:MULTISPECIES: S9 family peptidase [unclassified Pseudofrankia]|uniref:alpha/beta hydrolase family protein n=1 Tax=unclassified Pseudofrankia TaxID=2994372 RepID=UPI000ABB3547|nr:MULTISPECIES: alpha/beta fold hydrolase [unclassified Pseudofrankia]MDT3444385.1 alpha/beta fold hydrolase [Pseudofrankia sp. BMG5.37]
MRLAGAVLTLLALVSCGGSGASAPQSPRPVAAGAAPAAAGTGPVMAARTVKVASLDGTQIVTHFFPATGLRAGGRAPTVLDGPGWGQPGETDPATGSVAPLVAAGYNVVTWDPRGFGGSGGTAHTDYAPFEGRDVTALVAWLARQPETQLDATGDPRVGMVGSSYGGGIQFIAAASDPRIDAIVPAIAWHSLPESLYPDGANKAGWAGLLCQIGQSGKNRLDTHVIDSCRSATAFGQPSTEIMDWYADHGPASLLGKIRVPTLIIQGTVDTLFPLAQGVENYQALRGRVPLKMVWFCGGHGECLTNPGPSDHTEQLTISWLDRYLRQRQGTATGPGFEYVDDTGTWYGADSFPLAATGSLTATGQGVLTLDPSVTSGSATAAAPAAAGTAVEAAVPPPSAPGAIVGAPRLMVDYHGTAEPAGAVVYAQLVDADRHVVVDNQAVPVQLRLDGQQHSVSVDLATVAWHVTPGSHLALQVVAGSALFAPQTSRGSVSLSLSLTVPLAKAGTPVQAS